MDTKEILDLFEKFESSSLSEISIKKGDVEVMMKKGGAEKVAVYVEHHSPAAGPAQPQHIVQHVEKSDKPVPKQDGNDIITSPMVGTFYRAPAPGAPPFVEVGKQINPGDTLCIIEAMKLMNEIEAEHSGRITKVLIEDGQPIEFGQTLFLLDPAG